MGEHGLPIKQIFKMTTTKTILRVFILIFVLHLHSFLLCVGFDLTSMRQLRHRLATFVLGAKSQGRMAQRNAQPCVKTLKESLGLGKTTLAHILAQELGVKLKLTSGPSVNETISIDNLNIGQTFNSTLSSDNRLQTINLNIYPNPTKTTLNFSVVTSTSVVTGGVVEAAMLDSEQYVMLLDDLIRHQMQHIFQILSPCMPK